MEFRTIHTTYGVQRMTAAEATGIAINLTHMAVGDGGGNPTEPSEDQEMLVREQYRAEVNRVYRSPDNPQQFVAEMIIPKSAGGFTLREFAVFDDTGSMFVVGNMPEAYMPAEGEGAFTDVVLRCIFEVSNASVVTLKVDPNVAVASQLWVLNNITIGFLLPGGLVRQILAKRSNADGDIIWVDPDDLKATVTSIEEPQTLADQQTQVDLSITTTNGLAVYIEGLRLRRGPGEDEWSENPADPYTSLVLGRSYPAGTRIVAVQNDPMGNATEPLARSLNLADILDKPLARKNLGVFSREETRQMAPPGMVAHFANAVAPAGWLKANGAEVSRTAYADLFAAIGTAFGVGDGFNTFLLPDLRGEFVRGADDGRNVDPGRVLGSAQADQNKAHSHKGSTNTAGSHSHSSSGSGTVSLTYQSRNWAVGSDSTADGQRNGAGTLFTAASSKTTRTVEMNVSVGSGGSHSHTVSIENEGGGESRPRNVALLACIKY